YNDNFSSNTSDNNNSNITMPQFTPHFTSSPRAAHSQLPSSTHSPAFSVRPTTRSSSMPILSNTSQFLSSTQEQSKVTRLPPISVLTENLEIDNFHKKKDLSITKTPQLLTVNDWSIKSANFFRSNQWQHY
ncbi:11780_t:CDS:1, partial [Racocetra persica]